MRRSSIDFSGERNLAVDDGVSSKSAVSIDADQNQNTARYRSTPLSVDSGSFTLIYTGEGKQYPVGKV